MRMCGRNFKHFESIACKIIAFEVKQIIFLLILDVLCHQHLNLITQKFCIGDFILKKSCCESELKV